MTEDLSRWDDAIVEANKQISEESRAHDGQVGGHQDRTRRIISIIRPVRSEP